MARNCKYCGAEVKEEDLFCTACGKRLQTEGTWKKEEERAAKEQNENTSPLSVGSYFLMMLILLIPVVNLIFLIIWAVGKNTNVNRRNFSRAALIYVILEYVIGIVLVIAIFAFGYSELRYYNDYYYDAPYYEYIPSEEYYFPESEGDFIYSFTDTDMIREVWLTESDMTFL